MRGGRPLDGAGRRQVGPVGAGAMVWRPFSVPTGWQFSIITVGYFWLVISRRRCSPHFLLSLGLLARVIRLVTKHPVAQTFQPVQKNTLLFQGIYFNYLFQLVVLHYEMFMKKVGYRRDRLRVVVWIDGHPHAEFLGADDLRSRGKWWLRLKSPENEAKEFVVTPMNQSLSATPCSRWRGLNYGSGGKGVRGTWAVIPNVGNHETVIALAGLRRLERMR